MNDEISADVRRRFFGEFGGELKAALKEAPWDVWLVGGAVRSLRWNCPVKDWDLLCDCGDKKAVKSFAEALCRRLEASFVVLDELHGIYRAVDRCRRQLDFCTRAGACLQDDLNRRDFTINTLAVCLNGDLPVRGAEHAGEDIDGRRLRAVSAEAMLEDPVRIFRAWRFLAEYAERVGLIPHEALAGQLLQAQKLIFASAPERIWDELSRTLACPIIPVWDFLCQSGLSDFFGAQKFDDVYNLIKNFEKIAEDKFSELPKSGRMLYDWFNSGIGKTGRTYFSSFKLALLCGWNQVCGRAACGGHAVSASEADGGFREACRTCAEEWSSRLKLAVSEKKLLAELFAAAGEALRLLEEEAGNGSWHAFLSVKKYFPAAAALILILIKETESDSFCSLWQGLLCRESKNVNCGFRICGYGKLLDRLDGLLEDFLSSGPVSNPSLPVDGSGICRFLKVQPGPKVGKLLKKLAAECAERPVSEAEAEELLTLWNGE